MLKSYMSNEGLVWIYHNEKLNKGGQKTATYQMKRFPKYIWKNMVADTVSISREEMCFN